MAIMVSMILVVGVMPVLGSGHIDDFADRSSEEFYVGEQFNISTSNETHELYRVNNSGNNTFVGNFNPTNGNITVDTTYPDSSASSTGEFYLVDSNGSEVARWTQVEQTLSVTPNRTEYNKIDRFDNGDFRLSISSNREEFDAYVSSNSLSQDQLFNALQKYHAGQIQRATEDGEAVIRVNNIGNNSEVYLALENAPSGKHTFEFQATDAVASGSTTLEVYEDDYEAAQPKRFWVGQKITFSVEPETHTLFKVRQDQGDILVNEYNADNGRIELNTLLNNASTDVSPTGRFYFENSSGDVVAEWGVRQQTLITTVNRSFVNLNIQGDSQDVALEIESNRGQFDIFVDSTELDQDELLTVFNKSGYRTNPVNINGDKMIIVYDVSGESGDDVRLDFSGFDTGTYDMEILSADANPPTNDQAVNSTSVELGFGARGEALFQKVSYAENKGDVGRIPISLSSVERATINFGIDSDGYQANFTIVDGNNDGEVVLFFDTYKAGSGENVTAEEIFTTASEDDEIVMTKDGEINDTKIATEKLEEGLYTMRAFVDGEETSISTFQIQGRSTDGSTAYVMPKQAGPDVESFQEYGHQQQRVAEGDWLVLRFQASGLYSFLTEDTSPRELNQNGGIAQNHGVRVMIEQTNPDRNQNKQLINVSDAASLIVSEDTETFYLMYNTENSNTNLDPGEKFEARLQFLPDTYAYLDENNHGQNVTRRFQIVPRKVTPTLDVTQSLDGGLDGRYMLPARNTSVTATTDIAPQTRMTIRLRSIEGQEPLLKNKQVTVENDGTVSSDFNLTGLEPGRNMSVQFFPVSGRYPAEIAQPDTPPTIENVTVPTPVTVGDATSFSASVEDEGDVQYDWTFGDDSSSSLAQPVHQYARAGTYNVTLTVTDAEGQKDKVTRQVIVEQPPNTQPAIKAVTGPSTADTNETVNFAVVADDEETDQLEYTWQFGDGTRGSGLAVTHQYETAGQYTVTVTVTDGDGATASRTTTIQIEETESGEPVPEPTPNNTSETPTPTPEPPNPTPTETGPSPPDQPGFGIILAALALVGTAVVIFKRRS